MYKRFIIILYLICSIHLSSQELGYTEKEKILPDSLFTSQFFGRKLYLDSNRLFVGSSHSSIKIYTRDLTTNQFTLNQTIKSDSTSVSSGFGTELTLNDSLLSISAVNDNINEISKAGSVLIYKMDINGLFQFQQKIISNNPISSSGFGIVSKFYSGDLYISEYKQSKLHRYKKSESNEWVYSSTIDSTGSNLGVDFSFDNGFLFVGDHKINNDKGSVRIYKENGNNWEFHQEITAKTPTYGANFGRYVKSITNQLFVTEFDRNYHNKNSAGRVYIFRYNSSSDLFELQQQIVPPAAQNYGRFGMGLEVKNNRLAIGQYNAGNGSAYFYKYENNIWKFTQQIKPTSALASKARFGLSLAFDDELILVSAHGHKEGNFEDNGTILSFEKTNYIPQVELALPDTIVKENFSSFTIDLKRHFSDVETNDVDLIYNHYKPTIVQRYVSTSISNGILTISSHQDVSGTEMVLIKATDEAGLFVVDTITIEIENINSPPKVYYPLPDQNLPKNFDSYTIDLRKQIVNGYTYPVFYDMDSPQDSLKYSYEYVPANADSNILISMNGSVATISPVNNFSGSVDIKFIATDNDSVPLSGSHEVTFTVSNNEAPKVANPVVDFTLDEDFESHKINIKNVFTDDSTRFDLLTITTNSIGLESSVSDSTLNLTPTPNFFGEAKIYLKAKDEGGEQVIDTISVTISPIDDPPHRQYTLGTQTYDNNNLEDDNYNLRGYFEDVDNEDNEFVFDLVSNSNEALIKASITNNKYLLIEFPTTNPGTAEIIVQATMNSFTIKDTLRIIVNDVLPPELSSDVLHSSVEGLGRLLSVYTFLNEVLSAPPTMIAEDTVQSDTLTMVSFDSENFGYRSNYTVKHLGKQKFTFIGSDTAGNTFEDSLLFNIHLIDQTLNQVNIDENLTYINTLNSSRQNTYLYTNKVKMNEVYYTKDGTELTKVSPVYNIQSNQKARSDFTLRYNIKHVQYKKIEKMKIGLYKYNTETDRWSYAGGKNHQNYLTVSTDEFGIYALFHNSNHIAIPEKFVLHQNYPNPFNPTTTIRFEVPTRQFVNLTIYNIVGQKITELVNGAVDAGYKEVTWNGLNKMNQKVSSGIYFYQITTPTSRISKKMVLLK